MKSFLFTFLFLLSLNFLQAQTKKSPTYVGKGYFMFPDDKILNYGLQDAEGKEIVPPLYKNFTFFNDEYLIVNKGFSSYGLINLKNEAILPLQYNSIGNLNNEFATFTRSGFMGLLDVNGKIFLEADKYSLLVHYSEGFCTFRNGSYYGIIDKHGKEIVAGNKYTFIKDVYDGYAIAAIQGKYGVINLQSNWVINPDYEDVKYLKKGLYVTKKRITAGGVSNDNFGLKSPDGKVNIPEVYKDFFLLNNNQLLVQKYDGTYGIIDFNNEVIVPFKNRVISYLTPELYGISDFFKGIEVYNSKHEKVLDKAFEEVSSIADETCILAVNKEKTEIYVYTPKMEMVTTLPVSIKYVDSQKDRFLFNDNNVLYVINLNTKKVELKKEFISYTDAKLYNNNLYVKQSSYADFWDINSMQKIETIAVDEIGKFDENGLLKVKLGNNFGVYDYLGKLILDPSKTDLNIAPNGMIAAVKNSYSQTIDFYNKKGKYIFNLPTSSYQDDFKTDVGIAVKKNWTNFDFLDTLGNSVCKTATKLNPSLNAYTYNSISKEIYYTLPDCTIKSVKGYSDGRPFGSNNLAAVKDATSGKWGYMDKEGSLKITCQYDDAGIFFEGYALVLKDKNKLLIDASGKVITGSNYDDIAVFGDGLVGVKKDNKWGYVGLNGKNIISVNYDNLKPFVDGNAWVSKNDLFGLIDKKNKNVIPFQYKFAEYIGNGLSTFSNDLTNVGVINLNNQIVIPAEYSLFGNIFNKHLVLFKREGWSTTILK